MAQIVKNKRSNQIVTNSGVQMPNIPSASQLDAGELAINYASGYETLFIKNDQNQVVSFSNDTIITTLINNLSAEDVGALPLSGGTLSGPLTVSGSVNIQNSTGVNTGINAEGNPFSGTNVFNWPSSAGTLATQAEAKHIDYTTTKTTGTTKLTPNATFSAITAINSENGHITGYTLEEYTLPKKITVVETDGEERLIITNDANEEVEFVPKSYVDTKYTELMQKLLELSNKYTYTISYDLSGVKLSNSSTTVEKEESYATIISVNEGRTLSNVVVLMGDTDITPTSYDSDTQTISIPQVTDNVSIKVVANVNSYNVTYNLSNITSQNTTSSVEHGSVYNTILTPSTNYELENVVVLMNGVDITNDVYNNGVLIIPSITGPVVITAQASRPTYSVTTNLTEVTMIGMDTTVERGESFAATLIPTSHYVIDSITIEMGGQNITSSVYSEGQININQVTDNIVITASAILPQYAVITNLTHVSGDNPVSVVNNGDTYILNLTSDLGYELDTVTVLMDGIDVTESYYSDGQINIPEVNGQLLITANASIQVFSITYNIDSTLHPNNTTTSAEYGSRYSLTLHPESGVQVGVAQVFMGGEDITAQVYVGNTITIPSVTGDIVITMREQAQAVTVILNVDEHVVLGNDSTSVTYGAPYVNTIAAEEGYSLDNVIIMMGTQNITSTYFNGSTISIPSVTDNITINAISRINTYTVTVNATNATYDNKNNTAQYNSSYSTVLTPNLGTELTTVNVFMNSVDITDTAYDSTTHTVTIANVTGDIEITAEATSIVYSIENNLTNASNDNAITSIEYGATYNAQITVPEGYQMDVFTVYMGGNNITDSAVIGTRIVIPNVTGDVIVTVESSKIVFNIAYNLDSHAQLTNTASTIEYGEAYESTVEVEDYFEVSEVRVLMGGVVVPNAFDGTKISIDSVTGEISITVTTQQEEIDSIGYVDADNQKAIVINDNALRPGTYTMKYETEDDSEIDNMNNIITFTI